MKQVHLHEENTFKPAEEQGLMSEWGTGRMKGSFLLVPRGKEWIGFRNTIHHECKQNLAAASLWCSGRKLQTEVKLKRNTVSLRLFTAGGYNPAPLHFSQSVIAHKNQILVHDRLRSDCCLENRRARWRRLMHVLQTRLHRSFIKAGRKVGRQMKSS